MMSDVHENHRNGASAGRHQWPAAAAACGRNYVAAHIPCAAPPQLSAVFLGTIGLADRHVDDTDCNELVRLPDHQFKILTRARRSDRFCADGSLLSLGRRTR